MRNQTRFAIYPANRRRGFTLIEMLVSVTLVLLMMSIFAAIFQMASGSMSAQRGISENDQRARSIQTIMKGDLEKRTFRMMIPYSPSENTSSPNRFNNREGYFYISTNDPADVTDDVLQFTVNMNITIDNEDTTPIFGRGTQVVLPGSVLATTQDLIDDLVLNPNQPEADDGDIFPNSTSRSNAAEITYFVRGGNLYRRVTLLRKPLELAGEETQVQPDRADGADADSLPDDPFNLDATTFFYIPNGVGVAAVGSDDFWKYFDFAAYLPAGGTSPRFVGTDALSNEPTGATFFSLGKPNYRFGFDVTTGQPREFTNLTASRQFIGRFLHQETSHPDFNYPQAVSAIGNGNPFDMANSLNMAGTGDLDVIDEFESTTPVADGIRRSEDLVLANVHEFRIELFDERLNDFSFPGHARLNSTGVAGDFHALRNLNEAYGPMQATDPTVTTENHVFDTWHASIIPLSPSAIGTGLAPYRNYTFSPPIQPAGPMPADYPGPFASRGYWTPDTAYAVGDIVFPATEDLNDDGGLDPGEDGANSFPANGVLDTHSPSSPFLFTTYYQCVQAGTSTAIPMGGNMNSTGVDPGFSAEVSSLTSEDTDGDGNPGEAGEPIWRAFSNLRPVRSVRITVRFLDPTTDRMRQVTIQESLIDN